MGISSPRMSHGTFPDATPGKPAQELVARIQGDGGHVLAVYKEPVGDHWQVFALLPIDSVEATPYQRDLSPTHAKRLQEVVKKVDRFVDPIVAVSPRPGSYWTPNGHHRLTALKKLKAEWVPAIVIPEVEVAFLILALNTEKAHNLKEKSLEVVRMYRGLMEESPRARGRATTPSSSRPRTSSPSGCCTRRTSASPAARSLRS